MGRFYSFKSLAVLWAALAGTAGAATVALQQTYTPPHPVTAAVAPPVAASSPAAAPVPVAVPSALPVPFENRSLLAVLPPNAPPRLPAAVHAQPAAAPLPLPPAPPPTVHHAVTRLASQPAPARHGEPVLAYRDYEAPGPVAYGYGGGYGYPYGYVPGPRRGYYGWLPGE